MDEQRLSLGREKIYQAVSVLVMHSSRKKKELHVGNAGKPVANQGQCPGGPLKLHLNRGLASIVQR